MTDRPTHDAPLDRRDAEALANERAHQLEYLAAADLATAALINHQDDRLAAAVWIMWHDDTATTAGGVRALAVDMVTDRFSEAETAAWLIMRDGRESPVPADPDVYELAQAIGSKHVTRAAA